MTDYNLTAWTFSGTVPSTSPLGGAYSDHASFPMNIDFTQGSRAFNIKRTGNVLNFNPGGPAGFSLESSSSSIVGAAAGSTMSMQVRAPYSTSAAIVAGVTWYRDYTYPTMPPDGSGTLPVTFKAQISGASGSGTSTVDLSINYAPDFGIYNPSLFQDWLAIPFFNRPEELTDFDIEWHSNSSYTSLVASGASYEIMSAPQDTATFYLRYRRKPAGAWSNLGAQNWLDNRFL